MCAYEAHWVRIGEAQMCGHTDISPVAKKWQMRMIQTAGDNMGHLEGPHIVVNFVLTI